jgi:hypothetical protein
MDIGKYNKKRIPYPRKSDFTTIYYYADGELQYMETPLTGFVPKSGKVPSEICVKEKNIDTKNFQKALDEYRIAEDEVEQIFWKDLFEELGIPEDHPKADIFKSIAWSYGHSSGLGDVYSYACDIAELM